ncbi:unnamed protein product [Rotaria sordida]|uniref:SS18 N-terminal domain-containing protein n=1 Tax=Rotaria sordida TaxID=392033 RepID=A0A818W757_9BILA|nr:unnamed protein product [Rotaria sordida]CAF0807009.1 unnamed protein product [Rotaria sordida]CAF3711270.1 unnamed protein product [Rotaria sordida]CAF3721291.1 unnamed protein product [Rotaria sordida]
MYTQQQYQLGSVFQQKSTIQKLLDDNSQLISLILDLQSKGKQIECLEYERTLYRNLIYLIQFDPSTSHHPNNLPPPDAFIQTQQQPLINGNMPPQTQSDQIYRTQTNTLNQTAHHSNTSSYPLSTSTNSSVEQQHSSNSSISSHSNPVNKSTISQQRLPYLQQGRILNSNTMDSSYSQSYIPQQHSYSIQQNGYGQYPMYHQQQNPPLQSNSSTNTQNIISNQQIMNNNYNEQQQRYYPQQNYLMQQQWQNQSRMPMQQQQQYTSSYPQQVPPQA